MFGLARTARAAAGGLSPVGVAVFGHELERADGLVKVCVNPGDVVAPRSRQASVSRAHASVAAAGTVTAVFAHPLARYMAASARMSSS